jgi:curved DNA-binding protein CbpA
MLKRIDDLNYYELLEIGPDANSQDIHKAYDRIRKVYEPNSVALYSLLSPEETERIRQRIDEAYRTLIYDDSRREYDRILRERHEIPEPAPPKPRYQPRPAPAQPPPSREIPFPPSTRAEPHPASAATPVPQPVQPPPATIAEFTGLVIKLIRESKGLTLQNVADVTKVSARHIQHIEEEAFVKLPPRPYLRGFLMQYAKALGYEPDKLVADYLKRYDAATNPPKK